MIKQEHKLVEGKEYTFTIGKTIVIPGDNVEYIVIIDPYQKKHLLTAALYQNHDLQSGKKIHCRIAKINCNGKIFIEPEHPHYKEGENYDFEFIRYEKRINQIGEPEEVALVMDVFGNKLIAPLFEKEKTLKKKMPLNCKVEVIKKGKVHLSVIPRGRTIINLKAGESYEFKIIQRARGVDNHDYFVLEDHNNSHHLLRASYFTDYQINVGETIRGTVVKFGSDGKFIIEPDHPYYQVGKKYPFDALQIEEERDSQNKYPAFLVVRDKRKILYKVPLNHIPEKLNDLPAEVICLIDKVRKGKLILSLDEEL